MAVVPMPSPIASEKTSVSSDSVSPTVATASAPSRDTKKTSQTANTDSMTISSTMGTASSTTARLNGPSVNSCWLPPTAWRRAPQKVASGSLEAGEGEGSTLIGGDARLYGTVVESPGWSGRAR